MTIIAAYDVSEDARRARLAALLQAHGDRIQLSVFVLNIGHDDLRELCRKAGDIIDVERDSLYFFRQCETCWNAIDYLGQAAPPSPELAWIVL